MSPGIPPGKSSIRALSRNPFGLRSRFPCEIDFRCLAPPCLRAVGLASVDRVAVVTAQLARKTQQHESLFHSLSCFTCLVHQAASQTRSYAAMLLPVLYSSGFRSCSAG
jgi:hypothetical protein